MYYISALTIRFIPVHTNFIYLHSKLLSELSSNASSVVCVEMRYKGKVFYGSCYSESFYLNGENTLNISSAFANSLGLEEYETITLSSVQHVKSLKTVYVTPISSDDWGIVKNDAEAIQTSLLNQVRVITVHQKLVVWISKTFSLRIHIDKLDGENYWGKIEQFTELIVTSSVGSCGICEVTSDINVHLNNNNSWNFSFFKDFLSLIGFFKSENLTEIEPVAINSKFNCMGVFRCASADAFKNYLVANNLDYPYRAFIFLKHLDDCFWYHDNYKEYTLCRLTHLPFVSPRRSEFNKSDKIYDTSAESSLSCSQIYVRLYVIRSERFPVYEFTSTVEYPSVFVTDDIKCTLGFRANGKVKIDVVEKFDSIVDVTEINFSFVSSTPVSDIRKYSDDLKRYMSSHVLPGGSLILNNYCLFQSFDSELVHLSFNPANVSYVEMNYDQIERCEFKFVERKVDGLCEAPKAQCDDNLLNLSFFQNLAKTLKWNLNLELRGRQSQNEVIIGNSNHVLIEGETGSGKTSLINILVRQLENSLCGIFVTKIDCKSVKGKMVNKLEKMFESALNECIHYQPSVLILDDLDVLFVSVQQSNPQHSEKSTTSYSNRLSAVLSDLIRTCLSVHVTVLASATREAAFETSLYKARGAALFSIKLRIPPLEQNSRRDALIQLFRNKRSTKFDGNTVDRAYLVDISQRLEGYCIQDINDLTNRAHFEMLKRVGSRTVTSSSICKEDIELAITQMVPLSLKGVDFHKNTSTSWKNVGGLEDAKRILSEILIWPSRYPKVFEQCPLKIQSGVLLYGAPGCGKTLLASAVAGESCLNFISIKGPELLSKFVGESEEGVRNTFKKAQNAKPCILFFDEFESLAPRRGNDITGVTDRVVNQLLTELDGVESVSGVWVLAATSRPDLIDPALLRPGRLGTLVYCPLPNQNDRISILKAMCKMFNVSHQADLNALATITDGYTGADLQAAFYNAYIDYSKTDLKNPQELKDSFNVKVKYEIDADRLTNAIKETKPSLKLEERFNYEKLYTSFSRRAVRLDDISDKQRLMFA